MFALRVVDERHRRLRDAGEVADLARMVHAQFQRGDAVVLAQHAWNAAPLVEPLDPALARELRAGLYGGAAWLLACAAAELPLGALTALLRHGLPELLQFQQRQRRDPRRQRCRLAVTIGQPERPAEELDYLQRLLVR